MLRSSIYLEKNVLTPNIIDIPGGTPDWPADKIEKLMAEHCPLGRCAVPEDVARVVAFLASDDGGWVNGKPSDSPVILSYANKVHRPSDHDLWWLIPVNRPWPAA